MLNKIKEKNKIIFIIIWLAFFVFLIIQHKFIYMHFDDFGYASLSYGYTGNENGMSWTLKDFFSFLVWHYNNWGGRVLFYGIEILALKCGEWCIQFWQATLIWVISWFSYLLVKRKKFDCVAAWIIIILYGTICLPVASDGLFWYAASAGYVWPFAFFFSGIFFMQRMKSKKDILIAAVLFFIAGFSHEQISVAVIMFIAVCIIVDLFLKKEINRKRIPIFICGILGSLIEICAPGNFVRADSGDNLEFYQQSFLEKIKETVPIILKINLGSVNWILIVALVIVLSLICYYIAKHNKKCIVFIVSVINIFVDVLMLFTIIYDIDSILVDVIRITFALLCFVQIAYYLLTKGKDYYFALLVGGVCSQGMLVLSPAIYYRSVLPFQIILHVIIAYILISSLLYLKEMVLFIILIVISVPSIYNVGYITLGYYNNSEINLINRYKLKEKSTQIKAGDEINTIILYRLVDDRFTSQMPYQQKFIEVWVKNYFEIPQEIEFVWQEFGKSGTFYDSVIETN